MNRTLMKSSRPLTPSSSLLSAILLTAVLCVTAAAQSATGSVSGTVRDTAGAAVSGAEVSLVHSQGLRRTSLTGADGKFAFENVAPGSYAISVTRPGFGQYTSAVQMKPENKKELSVELEINPLSEEVTVTAEAGRVSDSRGLAQPGIVPVSSATRHPLTLR